MVHWFAGDSMVGMGPAAEESLGHVGLAVFLLVVGLAAGLITSTGIFVAYIVTREEYLLDLVRVGFGGGGWRAGRAGTRFVHGRGRMTVDLRIPTIPGRIKSVFHRLRRGRWWWWW